MHSLVIFILSLVILVLKFTNFPLKFFMFYIGLLWTDAEAEPPIL